MELNEQKVPQTMQRLTQKIITEVHVGPRPIGFCSGYREPSTTIINFHNFNESSRVVFSPSASFTSLGHEWRLWCIPCPDGTVDKVSIHLEYLGKIYLNIGWHISIVSKYGLDVTHFNNEGVWTASPPSTTNGARSWVHLKDYSKSILCGILNKGSISFQVRINALTTDNESLDNIIQKSLTNNILKLRFDDESSDISFDVQGKIFRAHRLILKAQAPELLELCGECDHGTPMPIADVDPISFHHMLAYLYGGDISNAVMKKRSKSILKASGKYGLSQLKTEAEAWCERHLELSTGNVINELLEADGHNWPLIKGAAIDFIVENSNEIIASESYDLLDESPTLRKEVVLAMSNVLNGMREKNRTHGNNV